MDEAAALDIVAVRAIEIADRSRALWTDADRAWATRAAAEVVGADAKPHVFLRRRAALALERLAERSKALPRAVRALRWRPWIGHAIVAGALLMGLAADRVGDAQRINVLAPPVLLLVVWNLAVYAAVIASYVVRFGEAREPGPLRGIVMRLAAGGERVRARLPEPLAAALATLAAEWSRIAAPLYAMRAARILHFAAAAFALGVIGGLYLRGLAFEYRATWESTFLDPAAVHTLLSIALAPGAIATGIAIPDVAQITAIRAPGSENAAHWLHLMAATLVVLVVLPRLALAVGCGIVERHRASRLRVALDEPYTQRLTRAWQGGPARVYVHPYSHTPEAASITGLEAMLARALGGSATMSVAPSVDYGEEDTLAHAAATPADGPVVALFNMVATPEREAHGAFVAALAARVAGTQPLLVVVDESAFRARFGNDEARVAERRLAWRDVLASSRIVPAFVDLARADPASAEAALDAALAAAET
jgi:hypothetical protein